MRTRVMKASSKCLQLRTCAIVASLRFVASFIHPAKEGHDLDLTQSLPNVHASVNKSVRLQYNAMQFFFTPPFLHQIPLNSLIFYSHRFSSFSKSFSFRVLYQRVISLSLFLFKEALSIFTFSVVYNSLHHQFKTHLYLSCGVYSWQNYHKYCASYQILFGTRRHNLDIRHSYNIIFFFSLSLFSISHF